VVICKFVEIQILKRILISPLDWGLGHSTRCIPVIRKLQEYDVEVVLAGSGRSLALLRFEFPELEYVLLPGYDIRYPLRGGMVWNMLLSVPRILKGIKREHRAVQQIVKDRKIDLIISDNRYGLYSSLVPSIFITHQIFIKAPFGQGMLHRINSSYIQRFSECWIPDTEGAENLSGDLSHSGKLPSNTFFVGSLSRFQKPSHTSVPDYDIIFLLSGPEPQRTALEEAILKQCSTLNLKMLMLRGIPEETRGRKEGNIEVSPHKSYRELEQILGGAGLVIGRSGYSTIMDMAALAKKCIFIPTPGQTEQEYLASYHARLGHCVVQEQTKLNLKLALEEVNSIQGFKSRGYSNEVLNERIREWIQA
jgi:UDP:flavonoid glycosyltransferase YjiC (YdhE family)